ncbi:hypothetical protein FNF28_01781 [Cafeteria roenbergensis]|uniref:Uncharacterized protein n=1 Tax=Cafeteria roenbergensis TaxID=33653 RepID=A0A5A8E293_CAFRO|nr:hypothetical protein FNF28_01781 [Cafeteria roenbergensis]
MSEGAGDATPFVESALAVALGGVICTEAVVVSVALIVRHLQKLSRPDLQYPIARMVMLVPVYSIASQIALTSGLVAAQAAATIRDVYEAYAVYLFFVLVVDYAGGEAAVVSKWGSGSEGTVGHVWPLSYCCGRVPLDAGFLRFCRRMMVQFVFTKLLAAILSLVMLAAGEFENDVFQWVLFTWYTLSYTAALYYLFMFYLGLKGQLRGLRPGAKFLVLKSAVFATYYIGLIIRGLPGLGGGPEKWDAFVTVMCMGLLAPAFWAAFGSAEFGVGGAASISIAHAATAEEEGHDCGVLTRRAWGLCDVAGLCRDALNQFDSQRSAYVMQGDSLEGQAERAAHIRRIGDAAAAADAASGAGDPSGRARGAIGSGYGVGGGGAAALPLSSTGHGSAGYSSAGYNSTPLAEGGPDDADIGDGGSDAWMAGSLLTPADSGPAGGFGAPSWRTGASAELPRGPEATEPSGQSGAGPGATAAAAAAATGGGQPGAQLPGRASGGSSVLGGSGGGTTGRFADVIHEASSVRASKHGTSALPGYGTG